MKRFYWKEIFMLSAPVGVIALGLVFVKLRSDEPTSSLFARWPEQTQISKCEVRPATPLEISQGADFGVTMQSVSPYSPRPVNGLRYSITEPASKSVTKSVTKSALPSVWSDERSEFHQAAHPLQRDYLVSQATAAFKRSVLKSADGVIEVDLKAGRKVKASPISEKVFRLDTKTIPPPDVNAVRKANFRITEAVLSNENTVRLRIDDSAEEFQGFLNPPKAVGKWTMEGHPNQAINAGIISWGRETRQSKTTKFLEFYVRFPNKKPPPIEGGKFRGLISLNSGWPLEVTLEWPKKIEWNGEGPAVKFSTKLAPFPK